MNESVATQMLKRGMRIRAWALSKGLSKQDISMLNELSCGRIKGRAKELHDMLEYDGFYIPKRVHE